MTTTTEGPGCFAVVTGGGTAGHVLPAIAVAEALVAAGHDPSTIRYVGSARGIERRLLPDTPFPHTFVDVVGFQRRLDRRNLGFVPKMTSATRAMIRAFRDDPPRVVVSVGGYASMPSVFAAERLGIPIVVVSYDRTPGRASRLAARRAAACAVAFEGSSLPRAEVTGAPLRRAILDVDRVADRAPARRALALPDDRFVVAVMGGSLGSAPLNAAINAYLTEHRDDPGLAVHQVAGERFAAGVERIGAPSGAEGVTHRIVGYEPDMAAVYAAADVLVGRGGASTVHEVAATGIPSILVPWPGATDDHQRDNIEWLTEVGGAVMLRDDQLDRLGGEIERLRADPEARAALSNAASRRGDVHRRGALASLIERVAVASSPS
ncbi:MAG: UDP-N-acetylglucosamine--N-acetylmuramyl-(pentapeptide) pyrophosphoryl-undecaprenol N-acetylglucosamine transferase [Ilumatobacteraceae bacterium]